MFPFRIIVEDVKRLELVDLCYLDINECQERREQINCAFEEGNGYCNNLEGSYECGCSAGYEGDGLSCTGDCM